MIEIWRDYPKIQNELIKIKEMIIEVNHSSERYLDESIDYLVATGGKMLRPAFTLLGGSFGDRKDKEKLNRMAAVIETLHLATLIHDDVIDDSSLRRGQQTIQSKYSKEYAIYMGDYLFTQCFLMLSEFEYSRENLHMVSKGISKIALGEMKQSRLRYNTEVTLKEYLKVISGKTAGLFAVSLGAGAHICDASEKQVKKLMKIGYHIGMAFQIVDDMLDYSDYETVGKDTLKDLANGYYTLPVIYALKSKYSPEIKEILKRDLNVNENIKEAIRLIKDSGAVEETKEIAQKYTHKALAGIREMPDGWGKEILLDVVPKLLKRVY